MVGHVAEVWRYPVKSLGGERLARARTERRGIVGDRLWAVVGADGKIGSGKTTQRFRRMPGLLGLAASTDAAGTAWIELPDGRRGRVDDPSVAAWVGEVTGEPVQVHRESTTSHFDDAPLHLVTTGAMAALEAIGLRGHSVDRRRFRPNLVVDADGPLDLPCRLEIGAETVIAVAGPTARCVMTTMAQPGLPFAPSTLKRLEQHRDGCFGVYATVEQGGGIAVGDPIVHLA